MTLSLGSFNRRSLFVNVLDPRI